MSSVADKSVTPQTPLALTPEYGLWDRILILRDQLIATKRFQRLAASLPIFRSISRSRASNLFDVIGGTYNGAIPLVGVNTFRLPDLRGRFPLGKDNMDNGGTVPNLTGGYVDAGGGNIDRVSGTAPDNLGDNGGQSANVLTVSNLPDHEHNMKGSTGQQYYATRVDSAIPTDTASLSDKGPTTVGQSQYIPSSGGIKTAGSLGQSFSVMNPFLTLNYIIRSGPPAF